MKLRLNQVSQSFNHQEILHQISFSTSDIQGLGIIGPSGGGKSTLLRILAGLDIQNLNTKMNQAPGEIFFDEKKLNFDGKSLHLHRTKMGVVFQSFNLFPHLSAWDNLMLPLIQVHHWELSKAKLRLDALLKRFQLSMHVHKFPSQLSGGQKQRMAIIRAISHHPEILFLDEPTSALDPEMASEVLHMILDLKKEGTKIVLVTHQMDFVKRVADEIAFLSQGKLVEFAKTSLLFSSSSQVEVVQFFQKILL
ncbi:MAG: ATP-binding cassette domain-containing protein [Bacteriovoracaceae bacterium]|nr:ATP-binding cassette domain-containing protein [Bacteriovoracaceae bacterium]